MLVKIDDPFVYDIEILRYFGIESFSLPKIYPNLYCYGKIKDFDIPIKCSIGDQQASFIGISIINLGSGMRSKLTLGTGSFFVSKVVSNDKNAVKTIAFSKSNYVTYASEIPIMVG